MKSKIPELIKNNNENITKLANKLDISRTLISKLANSSNLPDNSKISTLTKLAGYFNLDISDLYTYSLDSINIAMNKKLLSEGNPNFTLNELKKSTSMSEPIFQESRVLIFNVLLNGIDKTIYLFADIFISNESYNSLEPNLCINCFLPSNLDENIIKSILPDVYDLIKENIVSNNILLKNTFIIKQLMNYILDNDSMNIKRFEINDYSIFDMGIGTFKISQSDFDGNIEIVDADFQYMNNKFSISKFAPLYNGSTIKPKDLYPNQALVNLMQKKK